MLKCLNAVVDMIKILIMFRETMGWSIGILIRFKETMDWLIEILIMFIETMKQWVDRVIESNYRKGYCPAGILSG